MSVERARARRKDPTDAERRLWRELRRRRIHGYKFRRQRPIGNYVVEAKPEVVDYEAGMKRSVNLEAGLHTGESVTIR